MTTTTYIAKGDNGLHLRTATEIEISAYLSANDDLNKDRGDVAKRLRAFDRPQKIGNVWIDTWTGCGISHMNAGL